MSSFHVQLNREFKVITGLEREEPRERDIDLRSLSMKLKTMKTPKKPKLKSRSPPEFDIIAAASTTPARVLCGTLNAEQFDEFN